MPNLAETSVPAESRFARIVHKVAPIKRSEVVTVVFLTINVFVLLTCYYVLKVVREPLILLGGGAELKAYASAGQTLLLLFIVPAFGLLASRFSRLRLLTIIQLFFVGCLVAFYFLAQVEAPIGLAFYLWLGIFNVLVVANFWSFCTDLYTQEQGKRLFATIGIGASIGAILGSFVPQFLHAAIGTHALMLVAAGGLVLSTILYRLVDHRERNAIKEAAAEPDAPAPEPEVAMDKKGGFALVIKDRYLRLLAVMLLTATVINTTGEYVVGKLASDQSEVYAAAHVKVASPATPDKAEVAATKAARDEYISTFYSDYYTLVNLLAAVLQGFVVAWLLTKLGVRRALFIMPLVVLGGWFALLLFASMTMVRVEKTAENSLDYSLHNTLRAALFLPTSRASKYKAKVAIDTFFFRMGDVIAGLGLVFLLVHVLGLGVHAFAMLNVCLAVLWVFLAARAGKLHDERVAERAAHPEADA